MDKLYKLIDEIREYGENNSVPIMSRDTITTIQNIIKENNVKTTLEIGTAIGYSTICFASTGIDKIESIERDEDRYIKAVSNVEKSNLKNISLNLMDAFDFNTEDKYDLIIIDAAKSQNKKIFEKFKKVVDFIARLYYNLYCVTDETQTTRTQQHSLRGVAQLG